LKIFKRHRKIKEPRYFSLPDVADLAPKPSKRFARHLKENPAAAAGGKRQNACQAAEILRGLG
jgi:hypothetical protein